MTSLHPSAIDVFRDVLTYYCLSRTRIHERHLSHLKIRRCQDLLQQWCEDDGYLRLAQLSIQREPTTPTTKRTPQRLPRIYFATDKAADAVGFVVGDHSGRVLRSDPQPHTLYHRYQVSETRVCYDSSTKDAQLSPARWLIESDMRHDLPPKTPPNQRSVLYHSFKLPDRTISMCPDAASWHEIPQPDGRVISILGLWEIDLSSEGLRQLQRTKPRGHDLLLKTKEYERYWNAKPDVVRIFWVTPSKQRIDTIVRSFRDYPSVLASCRFLIQDHRDSKNVLTDPVWYDAVNRKHVPIVTL